MAEQSDGLLVAVAGSELLNEARQEYEGQVQEMVAQGRHAVATRDLKQAEQIAQRRAAGRPRQRAEPGGRF